LSYTINNSQINYLDFKEHNTAVSARRDQVLVIIGRAHFLDALGIVGQIFLILIRKREFVATNATIVLLIVAHAHKHDFIALCEADLTDHNAQIPLVLLAIHHGTFL
jgi:hypothetical protein